MRRLALALMLTTAASSAQAACRVADIAGSWRFQTTGNLEDLTPLRADCRLTFGQTGRLQDMACFADRNIAMGHLLEDLDWEENTAPAQVGLNCWVKITLRNLFDTEGIFLDGHMTGNKQAILGSGELFDNFGLVQFSMVRQSR